MENLDLKLHTVVLLIGPSNSGKSFFSKNRLIPGLRKAFSEVWAKMAHLPEPVIHYISSDDLRREVLGDPTAHKYDARMMQVSEKAFKQLHQRIDSAMEWPHNAQFIIVDTTGLNEDFRKKVVSQARAGQYNVAAIIFDYKEADEYLKHVPEDMQDKRILFKHLEKLRKDVWRNMSRDTYDQIFKIRSKDFDQYPISVRNLDTYASFFLDPKLRYDVIGDIHGCLDELQELIQKLGHTIEQDPSFPHGKIVAREGHGLVFVGDVIDKGPKSYETLRFVETNSSQSFIKFIWANHENFVLKYLTGKIKDTGMPEEVRKEYFSTTEEFNVGQELFADAVGRLQVLHERAAPFLIHPRFIVTHAPCEAKYLGKLDSLAVKMQRGQYRMPRRSEAQDLPAYVQEMEKHFSYLKTEAIGNAPLHVFGHVSFSSCLYIRNKVGIDTGCATGGRLSAASIDFGGRPYFVHVPSKQPVKESLVDLFRRSEGPKIDLNDLEPREYGRVMWSARDKVAFISGTIAPADADKNANNLESLDKALDYYRDQGVKEVVLQPKYMGSRCNVYLSRKLEDCFAVSRNGFRIRHVDMTSVFKKLQEEWDPRLQDGERIVLDGELMPWHALGSGLIEEQYKVVEYGLESEFAALAETGFYDELASAQEESKKVGFDDLVNNTPKEELAKKYGQARAHTYRCLMSLPWRRPEDFTDALSVYKEQIKIFGSPGEVDFKPFALLKYIREDGTEKNYQATGESNVEQFEHVSGDEYRVVRTDDPAWRAFAHKFFKEITADQKMEGIVVKPAVITDGVAPALKVRGENYLTLIYGYDYKFESKYKRLIDGKRTGRKMRTSIQEFKIGQQMLSIPHAEITEQNEDYLQLVAAMIAEERQEKTLDPRL